MTRRASQVFFTRIDGARYKFSPDEVVPDAVVKVLGADSPLLLPAADNDKPKAVRASKRASGKG